MTKALVIVMSAACLLACGAEQDQDQNQAFTRTDHDAGLQQLDAGDVGTNELALYKSGSRIKARVLRTADGAQAFVGWRDTQFDVNCIFAQAADLTTRCLPFGDAWVGAYFSDSSCSTYLAHRIRSPAGCTKPAPAFATEQLNTCPIVYRALRIGTATTPVTVYTNTSGTCVAVAPPAGTDLYTVLGQQMAQDFVEGTEELAQ